MVIGYIVIGMIAGFAGAAISLMANATLWQVFGAYTIAGTAGIVAAAAFVLIRSKMRPAPPRSAPMANGAIAPDPVAAPPDDIVEDARPARRSRAR